MGSLARLGLPVVAAFVLTSPALAAYAPRLVVSGDTISFSQTNADDPTNIGVILVPAGIGVAIQPPGTQIGTVEGQVFAGEIGTVVAFTGTIVAGDPASSSLRAIAIRCTGREVHTAIYLLHATGAGQSLPEVRLYVDTPALAPFTSFGSTSIWFCISHPSVEFLKIKVLSVIAHVPNVFMRPAGGGTFRWTVAAAAWKPDVPQNSESVEVQSIERTPVKTTFGATLDKKTGKVTLRGSALAGGEPLEGADVHILAGKKKVASKTTNDAGRFSAILELKKTTTYRATIATETHDLAGAACDPVITLQSFTFPCRTVTEAGVSATTRKVTVKKPKKGH